MKKGFFRRHATKLLLLPFVLLVIAVGVVIHMPKPEPLDIPKPVPRPHTAELAGTDSHAIKPLFNNITHVYRDLETEVASGVGMPAADREAYETAKDQLLSCQESTNDSQPSLENCVVEHMAWLVHDAQSDFDAAKRSGQGL